MDLRTDLIKLAHNKIDLRPLILPLVTNKTASGKPGQLALYQRTVKLAHARPDLRSELLPLLKEAAIRGAKEEAKGKKDDGGGKKKKEDGFFSKIKKVFTGPSEIEQLKDDLPQDGRKMDKEEAKAFAQHLTERVLKDVSKEVGEGVGEKFHEDEYEPDADDYKWFIETHGDKIHVPSAMNAFADRKLSKSILPWMNLRGAADAGMKVAYFFKVIRESRKVLLTGTLYAGVLGVKAAGKVFGAVAKKVAEKITKNPKKRKELEDGGDKMMRHMVSLRQMSDTYKNGLRKRESMGDKPSFWTEYGKAIWPALKELELPDKKRINQYLQRWDEQDSENEYHMSVLASFFKEALEQDNKSERAKEKRTRDILEYHKEDIAKFVTAQIKAALEGKDAPSPDTIKVENRLNMNNVLGEVKKNILAQMPEIRKTIDDTFEGQEDARKAILGQMDNAGAADRVESFLIPDVAGAIKGSKIKTIPQDYYLGIIPRQFGPDIEKLFKGYKKPDDLKEQKTKDKKERVEKERVEKLDKSEQESEEFYESYKGRTVYKPSTKRDVSIFTLSGSDDPQDKTEYQNLYKKWKAQRGGPQKKASLLYQAVVKLAYEVPEVRGDLIPLLIDDRTPHIPAIPPGIFEMNKRIDRAIDRAPHIPESIHPVKKKIQPVVM